MEKEDEYDELLFKIAEEEYAKEPGCVIGSILGFFALTAKEIAIQSLNKY